MHKKDHSSPEKETSIEEATSRDTTDASSHNEASESSANTSTSESIKTEDSTNTDNNTSPATKSSLLGRCSSMCRTLHPAWWLVIALILLLAVTIGCYEKKIHRANDRYENFMGMMQELDDRPSYYRHSNWMPMWPVDQDFNDMMQDMQRMQRSHQVMMDRMFDRPTVIMRQDSKPTSDANYSGYREVNGDFVRYNIQSQGNILKWTITWSNKDTLSSLKASIEKIGAKGELKDNTFQFTGSSTILNSILKTLGN